MNDSLEIEIQAFQFFARPTNAWATFTTLLVPHVLLLRLVVAHELLPRPVVGHGLLSGPLIGRVIARTARFGRGVKGAAVKLVM